MAGPLTAWLALCLLAGPLPPRGSVNLDRLARLDVAWQQVRELRAQAADLHAAAERVAPLLLPAVPPDRLPAPSGLGPVGTDLAALAAKVELQLLSEAQLSQIATARRRALATLVGGMQTQWAAAVSDSRRSWQRRGAEASEVDGTERLNLSVQLANAAPTERDRWQAELNRLDSIAVALDGELWAEHGTALTRTARALTHDTGVALDRVDTEALAQAQKELAERRTEQEQAAQRLEQARTEIHGTTAADQPDLALAAWRQRIADATRDGGEARREHVATLLTTAQALLDRADELAATLREQLPAKVRTRVSLLERLDGVTLLTEPVGGVPDVTATVAERLAELDASPEAFLPPLP